MTGKKMSKSDGNFVTIAELLETDKFGGRKWPGEVLRLAMLMTHYREPIDFSVKRLEEAEFRLQKWLGPHARRGVPERGKLLSDVVEALADDLDAHTAFVCLEQAVRQSIQADPNSIASIEKLELRDSVAATLVWLGIAKIEEFEVAREERKGVGRSAEAAIAGFALNELEKVIAERLELIAAKNWAEADKIRDELLEQGIQLKDGKDPETGERVTTWEVKR